MNQDLYQLALDSRLKSYSPYSGHKVGAGILLKNGERYGGCNVENSSYGGTICAERVAILKAVSENGGKIEIQEMVVVTDATPPWPPCGMCRQVISEFSGPDMRITGANLQAAIQEFKFGELHPHAFVPAHLGK